MGQTTKRMLEAMTLYNQMVKIPVEEQTAFLANLNAFITAARSVTFVMQKEFNKVPGFKEWYASKQKEMENDDDMKLFVDLRNESQKEKPVGHPVFHFHFLGGVTIPPGSTASFPALVCNKEGRLVLDKNNSVVEINGEPRPDIKYKVTADYEFTERPGISSKELCYDYFKKLDRLTTECQNRFSR